MEEQKIKVLGIHSSPFRGGNTAYLMEHALQGTANERGVETEALSLAGLNVSDCNQCNWCMRKQTPAQLCRIDHDISPILEKIRDCDVLVLASPVYSARLSGLMNEDLSCRTDKLGVRRDKQALQAASLMMGKAVATARMLKGKGQGGNGQ